MSYRSRKSTIAARSLIASATMLTAFALSFGVAATSSAALGSSPFCKTLISYEENDASKATPPTSLSAYHTWAAELVPFYEKLTSEAPNAKTEATLAEVVVILKWESKKESIASLEAYIAANRAKFEAGTKALAKAVESCA